MCACVFTCLFGCINSALLVKFWWTVQLTLKRVGSVGQKYGRKGNGGLLCLTRKRINILCQLSGLRFALGCRSSQENWRPTTNGFWMHSGELWGWIAAVPVVLMVRRFAILDCWPRILYGPRKVCVIFTMWLVYVRCETTAISRGLIFPVLKHAEWSRMQSNRCLVVRPTSQEYVSEWTQNKTAESEAVFQPLWHHEAGFEQYSAPGRVTHLVDGVSWYSYSRCYRVTSE